MPLACGCHAPTAVPATVPLARVARGRRFGGRVRIVGRDHRDAARIRDYAAELVGLKPDVILATNTPTTAALKEAIRLEPDTLITYNSLTQVYLYGLGALDAFDGYVSYRLLDERELAAEIAQMKELIDAQYRTLTITQDLGIGMMLWMSHFFPDEPWACMQRERGLLVLERMWIDPPGYFCREPYLPDVFFAFTNYGVSIGLQAVNVWPQRVAKLNDFFESYRSGDEYDTDAITHVMACSSWFPGELLARQPSAVRESRTG